MKDKLQWVLVIVVSMVLGAGALVGIDSLRGDDNGGSTATAVESPASSSTVTGVDNAGVALSITDSVADLYDAVRPSVVEINASNGGTTGGLGSGIVLDTDGNILTNNHVVSGFNTFDVIFADGTKASATVVGTDPGDDLAVIHVDGVDSSVLHPATLGDSDGVRIGDFVMAVGNPFELTGTLTTGVVSGIGRTLDSNGGKPLRELIQSDAAINPGNSGGALFDANGNVIGITTAIENPSGSRTFAGIGYAVPINTATRFLPALLDGSDIEHPRLGIAMTDLTPSMAQELNVPSDESGVVVTLVEPGTGADKAGLIGSRTGQGADVIVAIDGESINGYEDLASYIDSKNVGDTVTLTIYRDGQKMDVDVTLEAWVSSTT